MAMKILILLAVFSLGFCAVPGSAGPDSVADGLMHMLKEKMQNNAMQQEGHQDALFAFKESIRNSIARVMSKSCSDFCQSGGYGDGVIIGTAPFCAGNCNTDCTTHCAFGTTNWSDYGSGCWTGNKVCCCAKSKRSSV